eukprot:8825694-Pyramimonas_sp.AAC.1
MSSKPAFAARAINTASQFFFKNGQVAPGEPTTSSGPEGRSPWAGRRMLLVELMQVPGLAAQAGWGIWPGPGAA